MVPLSACAVCASALLQMKQRPLHVWIMLQTKEMCDSKGRKCSIKGDRKVHEQ